MKYTQLGDLTVSRIGLGSARSGIAHTLDRAHIIQRPISQNARYVCVGGEAERAQVRGRSPCCASATSCAA